MTSPHRPSEATDPLRSGETPHRALVRLALLLGAFVALSLALHLSGWNGPDELQDLVRSAGWAGVVVFVVGYAVLVLVPSPASVLTILGGALFGVWWGALLAWAGAVLGACGGFGIGRRLGRPAVDRLLRGKLQQADEVLTQHGLMAVLVVRMVPVFPFTPLSYAAGLLGVRFRHHLVGTAVGIVPGALAYAAVGASGADPTGIVIGVGGLVVLTLLGGGLGRRMLAHSRASSAPGAARPDAQTDRRPS